ncbi:MAG: hypothetical protein HY586_05965 [Candidatus Omnitrophica bacterium]|nr:hypothetical protein [Candidatus Omnitrophota bacterium]
MIEVIRYGSSRESCSRKCLEAGALKMSDVLIVNVRIFIVARLLVATVLLCLGFWALPEYRGMFSWLVVILCALSIVYLFWYVSEKRIRQLAYTQMALDLIWETVLVHVSGGVHSIFVVFYAMTILGSALMMPYRGSIAATFISCLMFVLLVLFESFQIEIPGWGLHLAPYYHPREYFQIFYITLVWITLFAIVGYLGAYFSSRIYHLERKIKNQEQLTSLGELTARIAHEIKNPLAAISGTVEVLQKDLENVISDENQKMMNSVIQETRRLKHILTSILDYARVNTLHKEYFDLNGAVSEVLAMVAHTSGCNGHIRVIKNFETKAVRYYGDANRMKQMLFNLVLNAYEAMPEKGDLVISVKDQKSEYVTISILDTGRGISKEMRKVLFQPFHTTKKEGTGLGLAIVQKIVESHGGKISVKEPVKSGRGAGTEFVIQLPRWSR